MNIPEKLRTTICALSILLLFFSLSPVNAQNVAGKSFYKKSASYTDSLKALNYNRIFPVWGGKVYKKGIDVPFPFGIMVNTFYGIQGIDISNIGIGINTSDTSYGPADLSHVIKFKSVESMVVNTNIRADLWVFPFLNVYGILGYMPYAQTSVELSEPVSLTSKPVQSGWNYGFGLMAAGGIGPIWISADYSCTWADMKLLENKVFTQITGVRAGYVIRFKNPEKNISVWIGAMGLYLNNDTKGEIALSDVFADVDQGKIDEIKQSYNDWYNDLNRGQQEVVDAIVQKLEDKLSGNTLNDVSITYTMDKTPSVHWAGLMGMQYQFNKAWQLRAESNFISGGERYSVLLSLNYRFLGFKKKTNSP